MKTRRKIKLQECEDHIQEILSLREFGYCVEDLNNRRQFRINGFIDIYPLKWRYIVLHRPQIINGAIQGDLREFIDKMAELYNKEAPWEPLIIF